MLTFDIITIFPKIFDSYFKESLLGKAQKNGILKINVHNLRDFAVGRHRSVDDKPYGGGVGMVLKVEPVYKAITAIKKKNKKARVILFSAKGKKLTQEKIKKLSKFDQIILICGRYEGVDERVIKYAADEEISIGDYVLAGGEVPAMVLIEGVSRYVKGVLGKEESLKEESFSFKDNKSQTTDHRQQITDNRNLEYPQYTRPEKFKNFKVPKVLLSGDHKKIRKWQEKNKK